MYLKYWQKKIQTKILGDVDIFFHMYIHAGQMFDSGQR